MEGADAEALRAADAHDSLPGGGPAQIVAQLVDELRLVPARIKCWVVIEVAAGVSGQC